MTTKLVQPGVGTNNQFKASQIVNPAQPTATKVTSVFSSISKFFSSLFTRETGREKHERAIQKAKNQEHVEMLKKQEIKNKEWDRQYQVSTEIARFGKELNPITRAFERFKDWQYARNLKTVHHGCREYTYTVDIKTGKSTAEKHQ